MLGHKHLPTPELEDCMYKHILVSTDGSNTRDHVGDPKSPLRNMIMAIVDKEEASV